MQCLWVKSCLSLGNSLYLWQWHPFRARLLTFYSTSRNRLRTCRTANPKVSEHLYYNVLARFLIESIQRVECLSNQQEAWARWFKCGTVILFISKSRTYSLFLLSYAQIKTPSISLRTQTVFEVKAHSASSCTLSRGESSGRDLVGIIVGVETMTNIARLSFFSFWLTKTLFAESRSQNRVCWHRSPVLRWASCLSLSADNSLPSPPLWALHCTPLWVGPNQPCGHSPLQTSKQCLAREITQQNCEHLMSPTWQTKLLPERTQAVSGALRVIARPRLLCLVLPQNSTGGSGIWSQSFQRIN